MRLDGWVNVTRSILGTFLTALVGVSSVACGGAQKKVVKLDPMVIKHVDSGKGRTVYVRDFELLYKDATDAYQAKKYPRAAELYDILAREFPADERLGATQFNAGLCYFALRKFDQAVVRFRDATRRRVGTRDARDSVFLMAQSFFNAGKYDHAAAIYSAVLGDAELDGPEVERIIGGKLGLLDQLEATARKGIALRQGGRPHEADKTFRKVQRIYNNHREVRLVAESPWVARAYYERGEIYRELFATIKFRLPVERMQKELEDKAQLFLKAQNQYFRCVRLHDKKWSLAAGYEIGTLYARLIDDIYAAEVPTDLDADTVSAYKEELWKHTRTLAKKAVVVFKKNIELAQRMGQTGQWVQRSVKQLDRMKTLLEQEDRRSKSYNAPVGAEKNDPNDKTPKDPARRKKRRK